MKLYDISCPKCGMINRNVDLQETDGWLECEECRTVARVLLLKPMIVVSRDEMNMPASCHWNKVAM